MIDRSTLRVAFRTLARHKGFTTVAILSLAIAIALNTVMYSVTIAMLDPRIGVRQPENIYTFRYYGNLQRRLNADDVERTLLASGKELIGATGSTRYQSAQSAPIVEANERFKRLDGVTIVRPNFFEFLGTPMVEGRSFRPSDEAEGGTPAVISHRLAEYLYPDMSAVGQRLTLDGNGYTVVGVFEYLAGFNLLARDLYILRPAATPPLRVNLLRFSRTLERFEMEHQFKLAAAQLALAAGEPVNESSVRGQAIYVKGNYNRLGGMQRALIGAVVAVLLVACANLANLQLARGLARSRELALRAAVGASRRQLIQLLMLESGVLAAGGLALSIALTLWGVFLVRATIPEVIAQYFIAPEVSWTMFVFAAVAALVCLFIVGLVPAIRISRVDPNEMLKSGAGTGANRHHRRRYGAMVVAQIGFALPVLIGSFLLLRGSYKLHSRHYLTNYVHGFDPRPIIAGSVPILRDSVKKAPRLLGVGEELVNRARSIPGVLEASAVTYGYGRNATVTIADLNGDQKEFNMFGSFAIVSPSHFRTMGREIIRGRGFRETEIDGRTIVIDQRSAKFLFKDQDPIGRQVMFAARNMPTKWYEVIGVIGDKRSWADIERQDPYAGFQMAEVYRAISAEDTLMLGRRSGSVNIYARVEGSTELAALRLLRNLRSIRGAERPTAEPLEFSMGISLQRQAIDFLAGLFATFAIIGIALVSIGVYSIVAHSVEERRRELAVRISMGATTRDILRAVLREGNVLILAGTAVGLYLSMRGTWWLSGPIDAYDLTSPMLYAYVAAGLFALAVVAAFIPALRATRIDPVEALRSE